MNYYRIRSDKYLVRFYMKKFDVEQNFCLVRPYNLSCRTTHNKDFLSASNNILHDKNSRITGDYSILLESFVLTLHCPLKSALRGIVVGFFKHQFGWPKDRTFVLMVWINLIIRHSGLEWLIMSGYSKEISLSGRFLLKRHCELSIFENDEVFMKAASAETTKSKSY